MRSNYKKAKNNKIRTTHRDSLIVKSYQAYNSALKYQELVHSFTTYGKFSMTEEMQKALVQLHMELMKLKDITGLGKAFKNSAT